MVHACRVKLSRGGRHQVIRIPRGFELPGEDLTIRKEGFRLVVELTAPRVSLDVLRSLHRIEEDFPAIDDPPPTGV